MPVRVERNETDRRIGRGGYGENLIYSGYLEDNSASCVDCGDERIGTRRNSLKKLLSKTEYD